MTYTKHSEPSIHQKYAKLRTETNVTNDRLRAAYERSANEELRKTVELERAHFQKQVDDKIAWCDAYAAQCDQAVNEARCLEEIAREQFEIVYHKNEELREQVISLQKQLAQCGETVRPKHKKGWSDATRRRYEGDGNAI